MSNDGGKQDTGSDAGWNNVQSKKSFNKNETWTGKSDSEVKTEIKEREDRQAKEKEFINSGKVENPFLTLKPIDKALKKGSVYTRTFFSNSVLSKKGVTYKGTKYSKTEFQNLSVNKQNEIYAGYMEGRLSGQTDAYGNENPNYGKDNNKPTRLTEKQIETESAAETEKDTRTEEEKEEDYKKVKGLKGSRSMFGNAGGRGYFDPA
jgi:hypothetical protein